MLFFLILFLIISIIFLILVLLMLSTIKIEVKNLKVENKKINDNFKIRISLNLFNKIKFFWITLDKKKLNKISKSEKIKKINFNKFKKKISFNKENIKDALKIKVNIEKFKLFINLGLEDAVLTSYIIAFVSSIIGIILPRISNKIKKCKYIINPIYNGKNYFNLKFDGITSIKIVHIMYVIYILNMKGRDKNERTSNRRSYGYSYGQY